MIRHSARWVIPVSRPPIENGCVAVSGKTIEYVGPLENAPAGETVDHGDSVILPGLINAHTHLELTFMRGFLEDLSFAEWISKLRRSRNEVLTEADMLDAARLGIVEGLHAGITTYADTCSTGVVLEALNEAGVRGIMYQEVFGPAASAADAAMDDLRARVDRLKPHRTPLTRLGISPHAPYTVSRELYESVAAYAAAEGLPLAMHIAESAEETQLVRDRSGPFAAALAARGIDPPASSRSPIALLETSGLLGPDSLLIHCVNLDDEDIATIRRFDAPIAHCPISNAKLGHGIAPAHRLTAAGVRVGLGSDSMASNNRMHMLGEARAALLFQRTLERRHDAPGYAWALELATIGGARALGIDDRVGTLEAGKDADIAIFPLGIASAPMLDPVASVVFALGGANASMVMVQGTTLVREGRVLRADPVLRARAADAGARLRSWEAAVG